MVSVTNSDASAWVVYGLGNNGYEIKLSSAADNSAPVLGTVTADNQNRIYPLSGCGGKTIKETVDGYIWIRI